MLPPWSCQYSWDFNSRDLIPVYVIYLHPLWRSWSMVYLQLSWIYWSFVCLHQEDFDILYIVRGDDHTCHSLYIMPIHGHCTLMYPGLLYVFAVMCRVWLLYYTVGWLVLQPGSSSLHFWDGIINYFGHRITPLTSHIRGHLLQPILPHMVDHTFMAFPVPMQTL